MAKGGGGGRGALPNFQRCYVCVRNPGKPKNDSLFHSSSRKEVSSHFNEFNNRLRKHAQKKSSPQYIDHPNYDDTKIKKESAEEK